VARTAYSLRHTYICFRLTEGADIYQLAKNCRTSVKMIEKYYASHIENMLNASAINIHRPWKNQEMVEQEPQVEESQRRVRDALDAERHADEDVVPTSLDDRASAIPLASKRKVPVGSHRVH
jgi:hypothetical protein